MVRVSLVPVAVIPLAGFNCGRSAGGARAERHGSARAQVHSYRHAELWRSCNFRRWRIRIKASGAQAGERRSLERSDGGDDDALQKKSVIKAIGKALNNQLLPLLLLSGLGLGCLWPYPGQCAAALGLGQVSTPGIFFISGLLLRLKELRNSSSEWPYLLVGLAIILLLSPLATGWVLIGGPSFPLSTDIVTAYCIFACAPMTLSSGLQLTTAAGGSVPLALALTVVSNMLGMFVFPLTFSILFPAVLGSFSTSPQVQVPVAEMVKNLIQFVLFPVVCGSLLYSQISHMSERAGIPNIIDQCKGSLKVISSVLLAVVPWILISQNSAVVRSLPLESVAMITVSSALLHLLFVFVAAVVAQLAVSAFGPDVACINSDSRATSPGIDSGKLSGHFAVPGVRASDSDFNGFVAYILLEGIGSVLYEKDLYGEPSSLANDSTQCKL